MADFQLTTQNDNLSGTSDADLFTGPAGGIDTLYGRGGNDVFRLGEVNHGTVNGGTGVDTVEAVSLWGLTFRDVEILSSGVHGLTTALIQLARFQTITSSNPVTSPIQIRLEHGRGGTLDLSTRIVDGHGVVISRNELTTAVDLAGTLADDELTGTQYADTLRGRDGSDVIFAGDGDVILGEVGDDYLVQFAPGQTNAHATLKGGQGDDYIELFNGSGAVNGGNGLDTLVASRDITMSTIVGVERLETTGLDATVAQLAAFSEIQGLSNNIEIAVSGPGGAINLAARITDGTAVRLDGSALTSTVTALLGDANDTIIGSLFDDRLSGGAGNDTITAYGNDTDYGGLGNDTITAYGGGIVYGQDGGDTINLIGPGAHIAKGGAGNDVFHVEESAATINGGDGDDRISGDLAEVSLTSVEILDGYAAVTLDQIRGFRLLTASQSTEVDLNISGEGGRFDFTTRVEEGYGVRMRPPTLTSSVDFTGTDQADYLRGSDFSDTLRGAGGNDTLLASGADDVLIGGTGDDLFILYAPGTSVRESATGGVDEIRVLDFDFSLASTKNVENLRLIGSADSSGEGTSAANVITGNSGDNVLAGLGGNDTLYGGDGDDSLYGGGGSDIFRFLDETSGADTIGDFNTSSDWFDLSGGAFIGISENALGTQLTHAGGTVLVEGVFGLSSDEWNARVLAGDDGGTAERALPVASVALAPAILLNHHLDGYFAS